MSSNLVNNIQNEIIEEFEILGDDKESTINYIIELGQRLAPLDEQLKIEENTIKGCQSKVWLVTQLEGNKIIFEADSNNFITKGLISLLVRVLSHQSVDEVFNADLYFIEKIGMKQMIGSQRSNGFASMIKQMKLYALAYKTKLSNEAALKK